MSIYTPCEFSALPNRWIRGNAPNPGLFTFCWPLKLTPTSMQLKCQGVRSRGACPCALWIRRITASMEEPAALLTSSGRSWPILLKNSVL
jgi:hypothetical protein